MTERDERILAAARAVFVADPGAPVAAVAARAGVGMSALYSRYPSKEALLLRLAAEGLDRYVAEAEAALADDGDPWAAFAGFLRRCVDAGSSSITLRLSGRFTPTEALQQAGRRAHELTQRVLDRTVTAGALRPGVQVGDVSLLLEALQAIAVGDDERSAELRRRYLAVLLDGLRAPGADSLPGPAPSWDELRRRYEP